MRTVGTAAVGVTIFSRHTVRQPLRFGDQADHIHAESVDAFFTPPVHHVKHMLPHIWIIPV